MKKLHFCNSRHSAEQVMRRLELGDNRNVVFMDWPDYEIINWFNGDEITDLVTLYIACSDGYTVNADAIVHHDLPPVARDDDFVKSANDRAPDACIIYKYSNHFEYGRVPFTTADQVSG